MARFFFTTILFSLLHSFACVGISAGDDHILFPNQTLSTDHTLISQNQVFVMGFFSPGKSLNKFMGIWYKSTPDVVFWVANRNNPITSSQSQRVVFMVSGDGSLVICKGKNIIWSVSSSSPHPRGLHLQLLDDGNLVLVDNTKQGYIWQSFDHPTDTLLPGMKLVVDSYGGLKSNLTSWRNPDDPSPGDFVYAIENRELPEGVTMRGRMKAFRFGQWNGIYFSGSTPFPNDLFTPDIVFEEEKMISIGELYKESLLTRLTLGASGSILRYTMNARKDKWNLDFKFPRESCDEYGTCGPNGICRSKIELPIRCQCLRGFAPKFQKDWDLHDWSGGCIRTKPLNCQGGDGFQEIRGVKYPDMVRFRFNRSMSLGECKGECLKDCSCTAYANPIITNGDIGCLMWYGDLIDTKELTTAHTKQNIYIRLPLSEVDFSIGFEDEKEKKRRMNIIFVSLASGFLVSAFINAAQLLLARRKKLVKWRNEDLELPVIKMATIVQATNNFSRENIIGVGGFGPVYKGIMPLGEEIAVKRLSRSSGQGLEEFKNEVMLIAKLQHRNLVRLTGCCIEKEERMLIYEYLQNKSLDYFVFEHNQRTLLTWPNRYDIIMGIARGLLYLHYDSRLKIIHRDLKTSNILLDGNLNPKISDFGLARIFQEDQSLGRTNRVVGTYGYMAPEYVIAGKFSEKSDVFSLGVVFLEIISGKKNRGFEHRDHYVALLGHAWLLWKENRILEVMDECLKDTFIESQVKRCVHVGLLCVQRFAEDRPNMPSVVSMLGSDGLVLPQPKEPGFFIETSSNDETKKHITSCDASPSRSENGSITITDLEAR